MPDKLLGKKTTAIRDQIEASPGHLDQHDPIFDSESEDEDCYFAKFDPPTQQQGDGIRPPTSPMSKPKMNLALFIDRTKSILQECFAAGALGETASAIKGLDCPQYLDYFVSLTIKLSFDRVLADQQRAAELLTVLFDSKVLQGSQIQRGFEKLTQSIEDLRLDVPAAADRLMSFFMCAQEDGLVGPEFMRRLPEGFLELLRPTPPDDAPLQAQLDTLREYKLACADFEPDFFNSGDSAEVAKFLDERNDSCLKHEFVKHLVKASFDKSDWEREMVSKTLNDRFGSGTTMFNQEDIDLAFCRLLGSLDDIILDCPDAPTLLAKFMVRAVVDELLPPICIKHFRRLRIGGHAGLVTLNKLQGWLKEKRGHMLSQQFRKIWTGTDPTRQEARDFKREVRTTIFEYFDTRDLKETQQAFNLMDLSPDQATEVVRKLMTFAMERTDKDCEAATLLLQYLMTCSELDHENVKLGFDQMYAHLADITLDIPDAPKRLQYFQEQAKRLNLLAPDYQDPVMTGNYIHAMPAKTQL